MRRIAVSCFLAVAAMLAGAATTLAWDSFCDWDPLVVIVTPAGHAVPVYDSVWTATPMQIGLPVESYTATRVYDAAGNPQTAVDVAIYVPGSLLSQFRTFDQVSTGPLGTGTVLASASGWSRSTVHLKFVLATA